MFSSKHITRVAAVALVAGGVAVPAASARPAVYTPPAHVTQTPTITPVPAAPANKPIYSRQDKQLVPRSPTQAPVTATPTVVSNPSGGFDWGDAAIGAGAGIGLSILGVGGAFAIQRRSRKPAAQTAASAVATS